MPGPVAFFCTRANSAFGIALFGRPFQDNRRPDNAPVSPTSRARGQPTRENRTFLFACSGSDTSQGKSVSFRNHQNCKYHCRTRPGVVSLLSPAPFLSDFGDNEFCKARENSPRCRMSKRSNVLFVPAGSGASALWVNRLPSPANNGFCTFPSGLPVFRTQRLRR